MGFAHKAALKEARDGEGYAGECGSRPRNRFKRVANLGRPRVKFDQESLFPLFHVHCGRGIGKAKPVRCVDHLDDPAQVQRPQPQGLKLNSNHLTRGNHGVCIGNVRPAQIEHVPAHEGPFCCIERCRPFTDHALASIVHKAERQICAGKEARLRSQQVRREYRQTGGGRNLLLDFRGGRPDQG